ncbi:MAG: GNAT family N-acetyltransferase [Desulfobulbaceae bacterium]|nr:GNAT family N-acetyltransferase [Desulfobulbaceae bacterium]
MPEILQLETKRLSLRRLTLDDAELMLAVWNDPAFIRYVADRGIRTIKAARAALKEGALKLFSDYGYGPFRVALTEDDTPVGVCGLFRREGLDEPDLGFSILPKYWRKGYAHEAARAVVGHAKTDIRLTRLTAIVSPENTASVALIEKLGLQFERMHRLPGDDDDVAIYCMRLDESARA